MKDGSDKAMIATKENRYSEKNNGFFESYVMCLMMSGLTQSCRTS